MYGTLRQGWNGAQEGQGSKMLETQHAANEAVRITVYDWHAIREQEAVG